MRPHVRTLSQVVLAVRALESLRYTALVSVMPQHVATVFVAAVTVRALVARRNVLDVFDAVGALHGPLQERIWKKRVHRRLVWKERVDTWGEFLARELPRTCLDPPLRGRGG